VALSLIPEHGEAVLGYDKALRERNRLLRDGVRDAGWYAALEGQMAAFGARVTAHRLEALSRLRAAPVSEEFPVAELALQGEAPGDAAELAAALREGRGRDFAAGRSLLGPHRDDLDAVYAAKGVAARLCSTGEQKALLISLVLANAHAVAAVFGAAPVLLLDEVAAHLDGDRRAALYRALGRLGAQAWMTGTDRGLFAELGNGAQFLAVSEQAGRSAIARG
jgi:DNA replication and repair protein RecF